jgi:hypothetical protein
VKKFLLALFAFAEELDVVNYDGIDRAESALKTRQVALFDCLDEAIDELLAAQQLNDGECGLALHFVADGVKKMGLAQPGAAVNEKRIIGIARGLTHGDAACVREPVAGAYHEIVKRIIGMKGRLISVFLARGVEASVAIGGKLDRYEVSGDLLGGPCKRASAVILEEVGTGIIGADNFERPARETRDAEIIEPLASINGI